jgi:transketolase
MLNPAAALVANPFAKDIHKAPTRDGFGIGTVEAGKADPRVMVVCADLKESTRAEWFEREFPDRFVEVGITEQHMAGFAAGLAAAGKIPFIASYAAFSPGRNYEQIRTTIALNRVPVKIGGMHAGVSVGPDGATHQMLEDLGMMRMLPRMVVLNPIDAEEGRKAVVAAVATADPTYLRFGRSAVPTITTAATPFSIGKALTLWESAAPRVAILSTGSVSSAALAAARALDADGIGSLVVHFGTVKPLDADAVVRAARATGFVITVEEHQIAGGFGSAVCEVLASGCPVPVRRLGIDDQFGQSGDPDELLEHYGLSSSKIAETVRAVAPTPSR